MLGSLAVGFSRKKDADIVMDAVCHGELGEEPLLGQ